MMRFLARLFFDERPVPSLVVSFPLASAYVCTDLECNTVSNSARSCPICWGSVHPIAAFLDRETEQLCH
jgi:hypothetical protein